MRAGTYFDESPVYAIRVMISFPPSLPLKMKIAEVLLFKYDVSAAPAVVPLIPIHIESTPLAPLRQCGDEVPAPCRPT